MITIDKVERDLMDYFAAIGAAHRTYSIRDFHTQVMMNAYASEERDCLALALARLAEAGIVQPASPTDYKLTEKGLSGVRAMRRSRP